MNLVQAFGSSALSRVSQPCLFWGERQVTFGDALSQSAWLGVELARKYQVKKGDRVGIWMHNCPEFVSAFFGILMAGGVVVPINNFLKPAEVAYILQDAGIDVLITDAEIAAVAGQIQDIRPSLRTVASADFATNSPLPTLAQVDPLLAETDLAVIIYTSGTTGHPKGAMLSHGNLLHNVDSCRQVLEIVQLDRLALVLPMFHSFMLTVCVLLPLIVGGSIVLVKSIHPPRSILLELGRHRATVLPGIPQLFRALAQFPLPPEMSLRLCISGSAPLPLAVLQEFQARQSIPLLEGYGLSEASPVVSLNPVRGPQKAGSIGRPIANVKVSIRNENGEEVPCGETGEVCVQGGNVMLGYWNNPSETAKALRDGWLYTGDVGRMDEDGFFYITDRKKDMMLVNGNNVYSREIEEVLYHYPGVREAAVVGWPDERRGEQPVAYVSMVEGVPFEEQAIVSFLRTRLADYKVPRKVILIAALPRNSTGKVLKTNLRTPRTG